VPQDRSIRVAEPLRNDGASGRLIVKLRSARPPAAVDFLSKCGLSEIPLMDRTSSITPQNGYAIFSV
jgi:hypothetical protein